MHILSFLYTKIRNFQAFCKWQMPDMLKRKVREETRKRGKNLQISSQIRRRKGNGFFGLGGTQAKPARRAGKSVKSADFAAMRTDNADMRRDNAALRRNAPALCTDTPASRRDAPAMHIREAAPSTGEAVRPAALPLPRAQTGYAYGGRTTGARPTPPPPAAPNTKRATARPLSEMSGRLVGVSGLEPEKTGPESVVLPITPYPKQSLLVTAPLLFASAKVVLSSIPARLPPFFFRKT